MALPFELPLVSSGFAALRPGHARIGAAALDAARQALGQLTGGDVSIRPTSLARPPRPVLGSHRLSIELAALTAHATLEVQESLAAILVERLAGPGASSPSVDQAAIDLAVLSMLDAVGAVPAVEPALSPRLSFSRAGPPEGLAVEFDVTLGPSSGRARLLVPPAALAALPADAGGPGAELPIDLSLRGGGAPLRAEEVASLEAGDVVLLDPPPPGRLIARAPGGLCVVGRDSGCELHVEEVHMAEPGEDWPITVEAELARFPVTLGELARLAPGSVLPIPVDRRGFVTLRAGDRPLARGELVDVEGSIAVRIDSLLGAVR